MSGYHDWLRSRWHGIHVAAGTEGVPMPIVVACPFCNTTLRAPDTMGGRKIRCPKCDAAVMVPSAGQETQQSLQAEPSPRRIERADTGSIAPKPPPMPARLPTDDDFNFSA